MVDNFKKLKIEYREYPVKARTFQEKSVTTKPTSTRNTIGAKKREGKFLDNASFGSFGLSLQIESRSRQASRAALDGFLYPDVEAGKKKEKRKKGKKRKKKKKKGKSMLDRA